MALTRKFLSALGIDADKIDEIISAHAETVDALKEERDKYKADAEALPGVQQELANANKKLETASGEENTYKTKYDTLKAEYDKYKSDQEAARAKATKESAYREILKEAGISEKRIDAVLRVTDLSKLEVGEDGKMKDHDELVNAVKTDWSDFIVTTEKRGAETHNPPDNGGDNAFNSMSLAGKMQYANEHPDDPMVVDWLKK